MDFNIESGFTRIIIFGTELTGIADSTAFLLIQTALFCVFRVFRASKIYCVIGRANPAPTEISPYFAQKLTQPGSLLFTASEKSINKTYICKNKTNILINKTIICINITFIYSFQRSVGK